MLEIQKFTFNPIQENMFVLYDETKECVIFDPGCYFDNEEQELKSFIIDNGLIPKRLINTHCHLDHICGNDFVSKEWNLPLEASKLDEYNLELSIKAGIMYNMPIKPSPHIAHDIVEDQIIQFGNTSLRAIFTPGHSSGSMSFYSERDKVLIAGDVIFRMSVGRYDLPGGDFEVLENTIKTKVYTLPKDTIIYSGHGDETTVGYEMKNNPFVTG